VDRAENFT